MPLPALPTPGTSTGWGATLNTYLNALSAEVDGVTTNLAATIRAHGETQGDDVRYVIEELIKRREAKSFNVIDYGADPTGATDSATYIQSCMNDAYAASSAGNYAQVVIPAGVYLCNSGLYCRTNLDAAGAWIVFAQTGGYVGMTIGADTGATLLAAHIHAPRVISQTTSSGMSGAYGLVLQNLNACDVYVPRVQQFSNGLTCQGVGTGFAYNTIRIGEMYRNQKQLILNPGSSGYVNQNMFLGGRFDSEPYTGTTDGGATNIYMFTGTSSNPNGNTWIGCSFEGNITAQYRIMVEGNYNQWINCRWENFTGASLVRWGSTTSKNLISGGAYVENLTSSGPNSGTATNKIATPWV